MMKKIFILLLLLFISFSSYSQNPAKFKNGIELTPIGAPSTPNDGTVYFDTTQKIFFGWDGTEWLNLGVKSTQQAQLQSSSFSVTWTTVGLNFDVIADRYFVVGIEYSASPTPITLDVADGSNDRIDIIIANSSGVISKITGTPAPSPAEPNYDLGTEIPLKFILVKTSATEPSNPGTGNDYADDLVYDENVGQPGEWDSQAQSDVDYAYAVDPFTGSVSTQISNINQGRLGRWETSTSVNKADISTVSFWIKLSETSNATMNITLTELSTSLAFSQVISLSSIVGFDNTSTAWQQLIFDISSFTPQINQLIVDNMFIYFYEANPTVTINIDELIIQTGSGTSPSQPGSGSVITQNLQSVTDEGNITTTPIEANSFVTTGGLATDFVMATGILNPSIDKSDLATELKTKVALGNVVGVVNIDALLGIHYTMNMTGNVTNLTFTNLTNEELKTITLEITSDGGSYTFFQPTSIKGDWSAFDSTLTNQIQIYMYDISTPLFTSGFFNF